MGEKVKKRVLIIGASLKPSRFSYMALKKLTEYNHEVFAIGNKEGEIFGVQIQKSNASLGNIDTVTLYINSINQINYEDYILKMHPKRIIFNPGTENSSLAAKSRAAGIEVVMDCTLVMLDAGSF